MDGLACLRCGTQMRYAAREKLQLGQTGWLLGDLPNLIAGALETEIYFCPKCGKLEFYCVESPEKEDHYSHGELPQKKCPHCGKQHDFDFPKCPYCNHNYFA